MTETTRNGRLAELAAAAHDFLDAHTGMPDVAAVQLSEFQSIKLQVTCGDVYALAEWARTLGAHVTFVDTGSYIEVFTAAAYGKHEVRLWTHIRGVAAWKLLASLDLELKRDQPAEVDPQRLLGNPSTEDCA